MAELTKEQIAELLRRSAGTYPGPENVSCDCKGLCGATHAALTELLERREAEQCPECKGTRYLENEGGHPSDGGFVTAPCPDCHGTGKRSVTQQIYSLATRELSEPGSDTGTLSAICTLIESGPWEETGKQGNTELIAALRETVLFRDTSGDAAYTLAVVRGKIKRLISRAEGKRV